MGKRLPAVLHTNLACCRENLLPICHESLVATTHSCLSGRLFRLRCSPGFLLAYLYFAASGRLHSKPFYDVPHRPRRVQMSRSSPGRHAAFEFASNVFEERFMDGSGHPLRAIKSDPRTWSVTSDGIVHVSYKLIGSKVDGTFVGINPPMLTSTSRRR